MQLFPRQSDSLSSLRRPPRTSRSSRFRRHRLRGIERLERRDLLAGLPYGATSKDTGEYMLGDVYVTVVFLESSTQTSPTNNNSETWTAAAISATKQKVQEGLQWWEDTLAGITTRHDLDFHLDFTYADNPVSTSFEPISRPSTDVQFWVYDFLNVVGFNRMGNFHDDIRAFNDAQRQSHDSDWAFTIFVVHDENDADHQFAPGGFSRAFAFAGGEFLVSPSSRPASTFAHETGHQFWALDEYRPDGDVTRFRGYYNTQNLNAWNNPAAGFVQQPSIMSNSTLLETAYANHTSAVSTLEMIGWKDSDADGVFDVLDVPLTLTGSGSYDSAAGKFRFQGYSSVQTLPNRNSSGAGNDITLNKVSRAEYRIDGGPWQMAAEYETWGADLDLEFAVPASASSVEIRTIDRVTGITSPVFETNLSGAAGVPLPGLNGVVWEDQDRDGAYDAAEPGVSGVTVRLVDTAGQPIQVQARVEPDNYAAGTRINSSTAGVTLSAIGVGVSDNTVAAQPANSASTGTRVFASFSSACGGFCTEWNSATRQLRIDLSSPASVVQLDAIGASLPGYGRLEIYNATGQLLGRYTTQQLATGAIETMVLTRAEGDIQYAIARSHADSLIRFDNLRIGAEASAVTDANGAYSLAFIGAGSYRVQVVPGAGQSATVPASAIHAVALAAGEARTNVNFGIASDPSRWQNPVLKFDVNGDGALSPIDALVVINNLNQLGSRALGPSDPTPPYLDVNGDSQVSPIDVLQIVNELNRENMGGEAESPPDSFTALSSVTEVDSLPASEGEASPHETRESLPWVQFGAGALVAEGPSSIPVAQREPRRAAADTARTLEESSATAAVALPAGSARTVRHDGTPDPGFATFAAGGLDEDLDALLDILAVDGRCGIPL